MVEDGAAAVKEGIRTGTTVAARKRQAADRNGPTLSDLEDPRLAVGVDREPVGPKADDRDVAVNRRQRREVGHAVTQVDRSARERLGELDGVGGAVQVSPLDRFPERHADAVAGERVVEGIDHERGRDGSVLEGFDPEVAVPLSGAADPPAVEERG